MADKVLREGYTTGSTATAAMKAAILALRGEFPKKVEILSPHEAVHYRPSWKKLMQKTASARRRF